MRKVKILCDSVCDILNYDDIDNGCEIFDIDYLPLYVRFDRELRKDFKETKPTQLYKEVEERNELPRTTCPSPDDYYNFFKKYIDLDYDIIFFSIGSELSGGFKSACLGAEEFEEGRVCIIDSKNISSGIGIQIIKACKYRDQGLSSKEIVSKIQKNIDKAKCKFVVDTMQYLYKGGRCSSLAAFAGSLLRIKPVIEVNNGKLGIYKSAFGKRNGLNTLIAAFKEDFDNQNIDLDCILVTHSEIKEEAIFLKDELVKLGVNEKCIHFSEANCTVATHCGPKCIGIIYLTK